MKPGGKLLAVSIAILGIVVLAVAGWATRDWMRESWYLSRFEQGTGEERWEAGLLLARGRSTRAALAFCREIERTAKADPDAVEAADLAKLIVMYREEAFPRLKFLEEGGDSGHEIYLVSSPSDVVYVLRTVRESVDFPDAIRAASAKALIKFEQR